jgi:putative ABC transport system ATP-binding protein
VIIRGPSGGGKTTFLNLIGTIDKSTQGNIWIDNDQITQNQSDNFLSKLRRDKIGIVFQTFNLLALMSAYENI